SHFFIWVVNYLYTHDLGWQTDFTGQKGSAWASHVLSISFEYYTFPITNIVLLELSSFVIELNIKSSSKRPRHFGRPCWRKAALERLCDQIDLRWRLWNRKPPLLQIPRLQKKRKQNPIRRLLTQNTILNTLYRTGWQIQITRWALWFFKNDKSKTWQANLRLISKFDTVEDFWALYNHIQLSSNLMPGCDYSLFKDGIEPMWEDEKNKRGGRWLITLNKQQRRSDLDRFWLETLLCLIGESFDDYSDDVCGAVVNVRAKGDKIAIWTTECEHSETVTHIGRVYKEELGLPPKIVTGYQSHADTATKSSSTTKNRSVVSHRQLPQAIKIWELKESLFKSRMDCI
uniref:Eukaryotic translation initiation factor 4E n=1 Tax=Capra hircus TaxID=9925 RepID=A0A8C2QW73_CAPHI